MKNLKPVRKAVLAYVLPTLGAIGGAMADGDITRPEVVVAIGVGLVTGTAVYRVPNTPARPVS